jgi:NADH:ubiquinone oxidoreductase subunit 2 (subunit N)
MSWRIREEREIGDGELKLLRLVSLIGVLIVFMSEKLLELLLELALVSPVGMSLNDP